MKRVSQAIVNAGSKRCPMPIWSAMYSSAMALVAIGLGAIRSVGVITAPTKVENQNGMPKIGRSMPY